MRIGIVCPYAWDVPGGVQVHIRDLAEALMEEGHQVSVIAPAADDDGLPGYVTSVGRPVPVSFNGSVARMSFGFLSANRVRRWVRDGRFDVLHVHEPFIPSVGLLACWVAKGPIVATFHASYGRSRAFSVATPVIMSALEKISARIAVSDAARKTLVEFIGGDAVLIPNGVTVRRYTEAEPLPRAAGGEVIGFLGRMDEPRKGLPVLLEAFALLAPRRPELRLLIAGPGDADEVLERVPAEFHDRVELLGMVSEEDKVRAYHSVDVFCAPNLGGESFGIVLTEAMSAGAAILASDIPAFRKVLDEGQAGALFETGNAASLAREAAALLDDPARRAKLSDEARTAVWKYDWSTVARDVARVYETVAVPAGVEEDDAP
ncbi:GDP-mannose-dependent alpha-(1-2)-phosphatidylinositol mannosyltransferase [Planomonospora parontospora subsp. parontospora]|uniref:GDP-mannose-dependent alpha-(1-2)-phosphatidylinositol mannosyltransferase n=2 Tax=Planomonospora parontospora TaxID=58119 RepID=A0AA37BLZ1_9ACTN|nr:glycosyltransferase family 4 protein [Planomonospora parontospora]GGK91402.1 GDP-mannose-dependent alpha-(1-2)-phosphatidylinositol mannosyltransferase [Planomonospora parontospora]GII11165.1 GDP-mannose-dependent alpha-(1-2)-phosphatidylinositol mannosyltransferase [Planomonospora parontospora subsp. parontospora]